MANQSNLPTIQRLKWEEVSREKTWQEGMQSLIAMLNNFISPVYDILNGGVTMQNLVSPQILIKTITAATITTFTFTNPLRIQPSAVLVANVWTGVPSTHPASAVQAFWHVSSNLVVVDNIAGLTAGTIYNLTLVII